MRTTKATRLNVRLAPATVAQLDTLATRYGNRTAVIETAVDRMYQQEGNMTTAYDRAVARVNATPELESYRDLLIEYDWPNADEHYDWVATAPIAELVDWAQGIREGESQEGDEQNA